MRRTIYLMLIAATAATPLAAQAQDARPHDQAEQHRDRGEGRDDRHDARNDRQPARQEQRAPQGDARRGQPGEVRRDQAQADIRRDRGEPNRDRANGFGDRQPGRPGIVNNQAGQHRDFRQDRRDDGRNDHRDFRNDRRDFAGDRHDSRDGQRWSGGQRGGGDWNRGWRNDRRYDWQGWRSGNRNLFRAPRYYAPRGYAYGYRRWAPGIRIESLLYGRNYWISDPWAYRLPPAEGPYRWVRYYDDVLLIDIRSGYVVDAIYGFFWH